MTGLRTRETLKADTPSEAALGAATRVRPNHSRMKDIQMAKALVGYMNTTDPRVVAHLVSENRRLRQRVADLEAHARRLETENDALAASMSERLLTVSDEMQPA